LLAADFGLPFSPSTAAPSASDPRYLERTLSGLLGERQDVAFAIE